LTPTRYENGSICICGGLPNDTGCGEPIYLLAASPDRQSTGGLHCLHNLGALQSTRVPTCFWAISTLRCLSTPDGSGICLLGPS
jgi:hypothetical protein